MVFVVALELGRIAEFGPTVDRPDFSAFGILVVVLAVALVAFGFVMTRPGTTAPIVNDDGTPVVGSVAELATVRLGGHQDVDFRTQVPRLDIPVYLVQGAHKLSARAEPTRRLGNMARSSISMSPRSSVFRRHHC